MPTIRPQGESVMDTKQGLWSQLPDTPYANAAGNAWLKGAGTTLKGAGWVLGNVAEEANDLTFGIPKFIGSTIWDNIPATKHYGGKILSGLGNVLKRPANAIQGAVTQEDWLQAAERGFWEPDKYDYTTGNKLADFASDPLLPLGVGAAAKASKLKKALPEGMEVKGLLGSSFINYIDDFYKPSLNTQQNIEAWFKHAKKAGYSEQTTLNGKKAIAGRGKMTSFLRWGTGGLYNIAKNSLSPKARAEWQQFGLNRSMLTSPYGENRVVAFKDIFNHKSKGNPTIKPEFQKEFDNRILAQRHTRMQSGAKLNKDDPFLSNLTATGKGSYLDNPSLTDITEVLGSTIKGKFWDEVTAKDLDILGGTLNAFKHKGVGILDDTNDVGIMIKKASTGTQNHWNNFKDGPIFNSLAVEIFNPKNAGKRFNFNKEAISQYTNNPEKYHRFLNNFYTKNPKIWSQDLKEIIKINNKNIKKKAKKDGVKDPQGLTYYMEEGDNIYISFSKTSGITEGGVQFKFRMKPNGTFIGVMADEHNFLEKIPLLGNLMEKLLPKREGTLSQIMTGSIFNTKKSVSQTGRASSPARQNYDKRKWSGPTPSQATKISRQRQSERSALFKTPALDKNILEYQRWKQRAGNLGAAGMFNASSSPE